VIKLSTKIEDSQGLTSEVIAAELQGEIVMGRLRPGDRLGEVALAERFEVSRGPIRAALKLLNEVGIVSIVPNSGARVRVMKRKDARALYEVRAALEAEAAMLAAQRAGVNATRKLGELLGQHAGEIQEHPKGAYLQAGGDRDFHLVIAELADSPIIEKYLSRELYPQLSLLRVKHRFVTGRGAEALLEHERIARAIIENEPEIARRLMYNHIRNSWSAIEAQLIEPEIHPT
jgi:DNA-binding GntR family transcriptional regulator